MAVSLDFIAASMEQLGAELDRLDQERAILQEIGESYRKLYLLRGGPATVAEEPTPLLEGPKEPPAPAVVAPTRPKRRGGRQRIARPAPESYPHIRGLYYGSKNRVWSGRVVVDGKGYVVSSADHDVCLSKFNDLRKSLGLPPVGRPPIELPANPPEAAAKPISSASAGRMLVTPADHYIGWGLSPADREEPVPFSAFLAWWKRTDNPTRQAWDDYEADEARMAKAVRLQLPASDANGATVCHRLWRADVPLEVFQAWYDGWLAEFSRPPGQNDWRRYRAERAA